MLQQIINTVLGIYEPNFHFIETISPQFPTSSGTFIIPNKQYTIQDNELLSGTSALILLSQALIISLLDNIYHQRIAELADIQLATTQDIITLCNKAVVCGYEKINYKNIIWMNEPDKSIQLTITKVKRKKGLVFISLDFSLSNRKHSGSVKCCYIENDFNSPYT